MALNNLVKTALLITVAVPVAFVASVQAQDDASVIAEERPSVVLDEDNLTAQAIMRPLKYVEREEGLKQLLRQCVHYAAQNLGVSGGFANNPEARLTVPSAYESSGAFVFRDEESGTVEDFFQRLNLAAERSIPRVAGYFIVAVDQLRDKDVLAVDDSENSSAATLQLHRRMARGLIEVVRPVIKLAMEEKGLKRRYALKSAGEDPVEAPTSFDAENYLIERVLEVFFTYMSKEEKALRAKTSSCSEDIICWYVVGEVPKEKDL